jgi:acetyl-CoA synthetase
LSDIYPVKPEIAARSYIPSREEYERLYRLSLDNPQWFWGEQAKNLSWFHPWQNVLDADYDEVDFSWFSGGRLNASFNCIDRHLEERGEQTAIIWAQDEPGAYRHITYRELKHQVCRVANVLTGPRHQARRPRLHLPRHDAGARLHDAGVRRGSAVHCALPSVFGGLQRGVSCATQSWTSACRMVVTGNEGLRGGQERSRSRRPSTKASRALSLVRGRCW